MEPVKSHWQSHNRLGEALIDGLRAKNMPVKGNGSLAMDLTQTSYSTIPSVDFEVGDTASDYSKKTTKRIARAIVVGLNQFFGI